MHQERFTNDKISNRLGVLEHLECRDRVVLPEFGYHPLSNPEDPAPPVDSPDWSPVANHTHWLGRERHFALRTSFSVPRDWDESLPVWLMVDLGDAQTFSHPEATVYIDGNAYAAADRHHQNIRLTDDLRDGEQHSVVLVGWTGYAGAPDESERLFMRPSSLGLIDIATREFATVARIALGAAQALREEDSARIGIQNALDEAFRELDFREPFGETFYSSVGPALGTLRDGLKGAGPPLPMAVTATGHAHIDVVWLWSQAETRRKAARTFRNAVLFLDEFENHHFTQSQPQLYEFVREDEPDLFRAIQKRVADRRWEPIGGMWVEADTNVTGAESLARQFVLGRQYFEEHFGEGAESPVLWLPDVFGYSGNLPQLIREAGLQYFFTIKISWNQTNRLPYDSFWWEGIDGTRVLTHFSPTPEEHSDFTRATYNAVPTAASAHGTWLNLQHKDLSRRALMSYGYGDGGGGPTREMIENLQELDAFPGLPSVRSGTVAEFFTNLERESGDRLPVWSGELYFELHRGTYTTQSRNKRLNRRAEFALHDAEFLAAFACLNAQFEYPTASFRDAWRTLCLNQFHDNLPGSSIHKVYTDSLSQYQEVLETASRIAGEAGEALGAECGGDVILVNATGHDRDDWALMKDRLDAGKRLRRSDTGEAVPIQQVEGGTLIAPGKVAALSLVPLTVEEAAGELEDTTGSLSVSPEHLENGLIRVELDAAGDITRILDKRNNREILRPGTRANQLMAFEDRPVRWDAWDIDISYDDKMWLADPADSIVILESGPVRATLQITRTILKSSFTQDVSLYANSPQLDIRTVINWNERHILLKAAFPVDVFTNVATSEIQWGQLQRPTHENTSWDRARFETCAQKWVDVSEADYGVSLLNDCKYGHDIHGGVMRISLLRGPTNPDPEADQGRHEFTYSVLPHAGSVGMETIRSGYQLNDPMFVIPGSPRQASGTRALLRIAPGSVVVETVKWAEDGDGLVLRLYQALHQRADVTIEFPFEVSGAERTNLLEESGVPLGLAATDAGSTASFRLRPFEIATIRVKPAEKAGGA